MKYFLKEIFTSELCSLIDSFSDSEKVVIFSLLEGRGIFRDKDYAIWGFISKNNNTESVLIITDNNAFLLGKNSGSINDLPDQLQNKTRKCTILGSEDIVRNFLGKNNTHFLMQKDFAFLGRKINKPEQRNDFELIENSSSEENCIDYAQMKSDFIFEESKKQIPWKNLLLSEKEYSNISPVLLKKSGKIIGMVSANFTSKEFAMINLMYIKPQYRKQGLGKYLLLNYIGYLLKKSKKISLFYSTNNTSAKFLYENIGFVKNCSWIMATPL